MFKTPLDAMTFFSRNLSLASDAILRAVEEPSHPEWSTLLVLARDKLDQRIVRKRQDGEEEEVSMSRYFVKNNRALHRANLNARLPVVSAGSEHHEAHRLCHEFINGLTVAVDKDAVARFNKEFKEVDKRMKRKMLSGPHGVTQLDVRYLEVGKGPLEARFAFSRKALEANSRAGKAWIKKNASILKKGLEGISARLMRELAAIEASELAPLFDDKGESTPAAPLSPVDDGRDPIEVISDELKGQKRKIFDFLSQQKDKSRFATIASITGAFSKGAATELAIFRALERLNTELLKLTNGTLEVEIERTERRARLRQNPPQK